MATISPQSSWIARGVHKTAWNNLTGSGDTLLPQTSPNLPDKTVSVDGTFASAVVTIQGSNDGIAYSTLNDPTGAALTFTADAIKQVLENPAFIRGVASGATGGTDVNIIMVES